MKFPQLLAFMMNLVKASTQTALDRFFRLVGTPELHMTQQSFSEARQKLRPEACRELFSHTAEQIYAHKVNRWHGMVVVAIDGSKIQLPDDKRLLETFGGMGPTSSSPTAQASVAYDVLNGTIVDAEIEPLCVGEQELAARHINSISAMPGMEKTLLLFDRGYSSSKLMELVTAWRVEIKKVGVFRHERKSRTAPRTSSPQRSLSSLETSVRSD